jgi:hypothetical protein
MVERPGADPADLFLDRVQHRQQQMPPGAGGVAAERGMTVGRRPLAPTPSRRGSGSVGRLMRAQAWWLVPIGQGKFVRGEHIDVQLIPGDPP